VCVIQWSEEKRVGKFHNNHKKITSPTSLVDFKIIYCLSSIKTNVKEILSTAMLRVQYE
jgi:hypothetical protein